MDNVLKISNEQSEFIPQQVISTNKVKLTIDGTNLKSGFYTIKNNQNNIKTIAFNYNKEESDLTYMDLDPLVKNNKNVSIATSIDSFFDEIFKFIRARNKKFFHISSNFRRW